MTSDIPALSWCTTNATTTSTASSTSPAVIVTNYINSYSWYRIWSDGWVEQGGLTGRVPVSGGVTVSLLVQMKSATYPIYLSVQEFGNGQAPGISGTPTATSFTVDYQDAGRTSPVYWRVCGYKK